MSIRVRAEDGALWATVDEYPGVFATGRTPDELRRSMEAGIALYVSRPGEPLPDATLTPLALAAASAAELMLDS